MVLDLRFNGEYWTYTVAACTASRARSVYAVYLQARPATIPIDKRASLKSEMRAVFAQRQREDSASTA